MIATSPGTVWRIDDRAGFAELRRRGQRRRSGALQVIFAPSPLDRPPRVAYAIGRRVGSAVVRNRVRRRLRAVVGQLAAKDRLAGGDYLVVVAPRAAQASFTMLREWMTTACAKQGQTVR